MKNPTIKIDFLKTPTDDFKTVKGLKKYWLSIKPLIEQRERHFESVWKKGSEQEIFAELAFCLFTPQSKAEFCWKAVCALADKGMLFKSSAAEIADTISAVRFRRNKSAFLVKAREQFMPKGKLEIKKVLASFKDIYELRLWLIKNIKGIGFKEAGHFLRNIGLSKELAILDRHILKNLLLFGAIKEIPASLTPSVYTKIEKQTLAFAKKISVPPSHLDMVFWCKESGGIFK